MAKGFTQTYDTDYSETFASIAKLNTNPFISCCKLNKLVPWEVIDNNVMENMVKVDPAGKKLIVCVQLCCQYEDLIGGQCKYTISAFEGCF
ncbi:hypothetical protein MTR_4g114540 [Medicago truncatula]|uniref:Uncharacterized protein n=1 Tax=Medicago truncatula TaxID=3880 RepID=G7JCZ9_MEDTR|nr:hypothetical protein MTR_4g114540 [Medicago truncatula]